MNKIMEIAARNLLRYQRRTLLTSMLIVIGVVAVLLFVAITGSFKQMMVGQITDSMLGHAQIHRRGYVASIESLPLNMNMPPAMVARVTKALEEEPMIEAVAPRVKFGAMFSNYTETTSVRVNGIDPETEVKVTPLLAERQLDGERKGPLLKRGEMLVPVLVAARDLAPGHVLQAGDWKWQTLDLAKLPAEVIESEQSAQNKEIVRNISSGRPLQLNDLRAITVIKTGDQVKLNIMGQGFSIDASAVALTQAAVGDTVRVRLPEGRVLQGVAVSAGVVEVNLDQR